MTKSSFEFERRPANYVPLSPVSFLTRTARVYPGRIAMVYGERRYDYAHLLARSRALAASLHGAGVERGEVVAVMAQNTPEMLEAHYGVPMLGAVLCSINCRLDARTVGFILDHAQARLLIADLEFAKVVSEALDGLATPPRVVWIDDPAFAGAKPAIGPEAAYEAFLASADSAFEPAPLDDEWRPIALNYTSGTTGEPKGVVLHHRGAYLNACANVMAFGLSTDSVYLWTLPMFHCNGWTHTWAVTLAGGMHVCLRRTEPLEVFKAIAAHRVTHLCGAPVVLRMLIDFPADQRPTFAHRVTVATGGAAPPSRVLAEMEAMGFAVTHLYGMTECYGPSAVCAPQPGVETLPLEARAAFVARQGVAHPMAEAVTVVALDDGREVPRDGATVGELVVRSNTVMAGYLKNPAATEAALADGWLHTGDLAVLHPDGYVEIKDRMKDVIISGGENISSLEIEEVVCRHPAVAEAAVVARPDPKWGETPHLFVRARDGVADTLTAEGLIAWCRERLPHFKCPRHVTLGDLPKTATGKIQKTVLRDRAAEAARGGP